jgi:hypothetical protein
MDIKDKLEEIHKDVREIKESQNSLVTVMVSLRDNTWHQFKVIHDKLMELFSWGRKE